LLCLTCGDVGGGQLKPKAIGLDLSYQAALYEERTITGNRNPSVNGRYKNFSHSGGIQLAISLLRKPCSGLMRID
jgi:long-chain fatty acid transport protein